MCIRDSHERADGVRGQACQQVGQGVTPEGCQRRCLKRTGWLRRFRSFGLWVIPSRSDRHLHPQIMRPETRISGGSRGTVSQSPRGVMPAWPFLLSELKDGDSGRAAGSGTFRTWPVRSTTKFGGRAMSPLDPLDIGGASGGLFTIRAVC